MLSIIEWQNLSEGLVLIDYLKDSSLYTNWIDCSNYQIKRSWLSLLRVGYLCVHDWLSLLGRTCYWLHFFLGLFGSNVSEFRLDGWVGCYLEQWTGGAGGRRFGDARSFSAGLHFGCGGRLLRPTMAFQYFFFTLTRNASVETVEYWFQCERRVSHSYWIHYYAWMGFTEGNFEELHPSYYYYFTAVISLRTGRLLTI